jgi:hypothetical protein
LVVYAGKSATEISAMAQAAVESLVKCTLYQEFQVTLETRKGMIIMKNVRRIETGDCLVKAAKDNFHLIKSIINGRRKMCYRMV